MCCSFRADRFLVLLGKRGLVVAMERSRSTRRGGRAGRRGEEISAAPIPVSGAGSATPTVGLADPRATNNGHPRRINYRRSIQNTGTVTRMGDCVQRLSVIKAAGASASAKFSACLVQYVADPPDRHCCVISKRSDGFAAFIRRAHRVVIGELRGQDWATLISPMGASARRNVFRGFVAPSGPSRVGVAGEHFKTGAG